MPIFLRLIPVVLCAWCSFGNVVGAAAALEQARLTQVFRNVRVTVQNSPPVPASVNTALGDGAVQTGADSRAEITFANQTVARLGDKTILGFTSKNRTFDLTSGAILTQVPRGWRGTKLKVGAVTATVTGTTLLSEYHPNAYAKFILLDGTVRFCLKKPGHANDCVLLRAGQMLIANLDATGLPDAADVDLDRLLKTCHLITDFPKLPGHEFLVKAVAKQRGDKSHGAFVDTNLVIFGRGTLVSLIDPNAPEAKKGEASAAPTPAATPIESSASVTP